MKQIFLLSLICLSCTFLVAQTDTVHLRDIQKNTKTIITDRPPQAAYFQIGGSAPIFSVNYDRRFTKTVNGFGFCAGIGYFAESGGSIFSIPLSINYLIGKSSSFIEVAAGATYASAQENLFNSSSGNSIIFFHLNGGYRYQPTKGGFFFRGGISPLFYQGEVVTSFYIGFGHNF